jgi:hypothetical protein
MPSAGERFAKMVRVTEGVTTSLTDLEAVAKADLDRKPAGAPRRVRPVCEGRDDSGVPREDGRQQATGGAVRGRARATRHAEGLRGRSRRRDDPGTRAGARRSLAAVQTARTSPYIDIPGPYEKNLPSIYYIAPPDPAWTPA